MPFKAACLSGFSMSKDSQLFQHLFQTIFTQLQPQIHCDEELLLGASYPVHYLPVPGISSSKGLELMLMSVGKVAK